MLLPLQHYNWRGSLELPRKCDTANARHGYGLPVLEHWGPFCAYCGRDLSKPYEAWLDTSVDHVVPARALKLWGGERKNWLGSLANLVPCCRPCNEFLNGYRTGLTSVPPADEARFLALRDAMLAGKREHALMRHAQEREYYERWLEDLRQVYFDGATSRGPEAATMTDQTEVTESTGNVFADICIPEPEEALAKADLAIKICDIIAERGLTQRQAAKVLGIDQPKVSALRRGRLEGFSLSRLFRFLNALDRDVEIVIKPKSGADGTASTRIVTA